MRGKAKQRVSLILVVTMVLGTALTGNTVFATGESSDEQDRIKINISKDSEQTVEQNVAQTIHVTAQGQCSQSVCLNVYLKNEDGSAATDIDAVNLLTSDQLTDKNTQKTIDETLKDSVTLNDGTKTSPKAEWKNDKDENGTVTSKYLQITMPADATAINFDMQLQYRTDEASYTKKVLVEAKAFEEEQDITEAAKRADESKENETTVVWEGQAVSQPESEAADEDADGENNINTVSETGVYTLYFEQNTIDDPHSAWDNATQISVYAFSNNDNTGVLQMYKVPESDSKNIWKITFDKEWTHVIFLTGDDWSGFFNQTEDIQIDWSLNSPCYKLRGDAASDNRKKVDTPFEYKETPLAADGITVYYDATLSKLSYATDKYFLQSNTNPVFTYGIDLLKKGEGTNKVLKGVEFTLTDNTDKAVNVKKNDSNTFYTPGGSSNTVTTDDQGKIYIRGLKPGTYKLIETKTNAGYVLLKNPVVIVITQTNAETGAATATVGDKAVTMNSDQNNKDSATAEVPLTVVNSKGFDLPATGGRGIALFTIAGITIVAAAGSLLFMRKRSK